MLHYFSDSTLIGLSRRFLTPFCNSNAFLIPAKLDSIPYAHYSFHAQKLCYDFINVSICITDEL